MNDSRNRKKRNKITRNEIKKIIFPILTTGYGAMVSQSGSIFSIGKRK